MFQQINGRYHFAEQTKFENSKHAQQNKTASSACVF
jgi:hypothetical protein